MKSRDSQSRQYYIGMVYDWALDLDQETRMQEMVTVSLTLGTEDTGDCICINTVWCCHVYTEVWWRHEAACHASCPSPSPGLHPDWCPAWTQSWPGPCMPQLYALTVYVYLCLYDEYNINIKHPLIVKLFFPDTAEIGAPDIVSHIMLRFMFTISPIISK